MPLPSDKLYEILELERNATEAEIKKSYRRLSLHYHPDRNMNKSQEERQQLTEKFTGISNAYEILMDPKKLRDFNANKVNDTGAQTDRSQKASQQTPGQSQWKREHSSNSNYRSQQKWHETNFTKNKPKHSTYTNNNDSDNHDSNYAKNSHSHNEQFDYQFAEPKFIPMDADVIIITVLFSLNLLNTPKPQPQRATSKTPNTSAAQTSSTEDKKHDTSHRSEVRSSLDTLLILMALEKMLNATARLYPEVQEPSQESSFTFRPR